MKVDDGKPDTVIISIQRLVIFLFFYQYSGTVFWIAAISKHLDPLSLQNFLECIKNWCTVWAYLILITETRYAG